MKCQITFGNKGLAKVAEQSTADNFLVNQTFVLRIKFSGKKPARRKSAKR